MKRKVIQIAGSTQLVSLPRQWAKAHNIQRGAELDVQEDGNRVIVSADGSPIFEKTELDISGLGSMTHRVLGSYYRAGIDEIRVTYNNSGMVETIYDSLNRETMIGFEVLEQGNNYCILKSVAGESEEFDSVLRRTFLLLVNMASECTRLISEKKFEIINSISFMEKSNNRFTTICRRILNKSVSSSSHRAVGPLYFIVENLENIADEYKYIAQHYSNLANKKMSIDKDALAAFEKANSIVRLFYETYYKSDIKSLIELKKIRDEVVDSAHKIFGRKVPSIDIWLTHHAIIIVTLVFNLVGPMIAASVKEKRFSLTNT